MNNSTTQPSLQTNGMDSVIQPGSRRLYVQPEILIELVLETRAGSPLGGEDPLGLDMP